jgi:hypothetical protein
MRTRGPTVWLLSGALLGVAACDRAHDFACTATWGDGQKQLSQKVYRYPELTDENQATARCRDDMMKDRPGGATAAKCECTTE